MPSRFTGLEPYSPTYSLPGVTWDAYDDVPFDPAYVSLAHLEHGIRTALKG